ncbi:MAG: phosphoenolpyruvate--protein phosphotransferase [Thermodesulfobacteriota bacterium]|nr:MAG: phosphoenolpyruvate--protein phosphotransferase [Thermodesulfobacteriota bacterium]
MTVEKKKVDLMRGIGVSSGIVTGTAHVLKRGVDFTAHYCHLGEEETLSEIERFKTALAESQDQLRRVKEKMVSDGMDVEHVRIIEAHLLILKDRMLIDDTVGLIKKEKVNAEWALKKVLEKLLKYFENVDDEYLRERSYDFEHIVNRILFNLSGKYHESITDIKEPSIVIAHDLAPSDTVQMDKKTVLGFLTDLGGKTSHTAIIARALEIPAVVGLENITSRVEDGDVVIIDGTTGTVIINPSEKVVDVYRKRRKRYENYGRTLFHYKDLPCETTDGYRMSLMGNMEMMEEVDALMVHGAEGIGLYRTEFLYLRNKHMPTEEEHFEAYTKVAARLAPNPVIIRTLDVGADKGLPGLEHSEEINPALGLRAIRFCLKNRDIFKAQLRGLLRASVAGNIKVMFPMISGIEELRRAKAVLEEAKDELRTEKKAFDPDIKVGVMIEIPSAAIIADLIVKEVDFMSIGTNDLLQYSLAIDRVNEHVAYLYQPFHPAVLRIIKTVADAATKGGISVGVCGEMAGEPEYAFILLGFGIDKLSMNAFSILKVKRLLRSVSYADAKKICGEIIKFATAKEVELHIRAKLSDLYTEEFFS